MQIEPHIIFNARRAQKERKRHGAQISLCVCVYIHMHACIRVSLRIFLLAQKAHQRPPLSVSRVKLGNILDSVRAVSLFLIDRLWSLAPKERPPPPPPRSKAENAFVRSCCSPSLTRNVSSLFLSQIQSNHPKQAGASKRVLQAKQKKFNSNIHKRGMVDINSSTKDKEKFTVGPVVLAFFIFVVIGSSLLQMIRTLQTGKP